jgi:hypothetical protein
VKNMAEAAAGLVETDRLVFMEDTQEQPA